MYSTTRFALVCMLIFAAAPLFAADLLLGNVNGYTLDRAGTLQRFDALLVDAGKVVAAGKRTDLAKRAGDAKVVDGKGRTVLPGLIDAPDNAVTRLRCYAAIASALMNWEPRLRVTRIGLQSGETPGQATLTLEGEYLPTGRTVGVSAALQLRGAA